MHVQIRNLNALLFKLLQRMQNGMMLKRSRNDVLLVLASTNFHRGKNRLVISLAAARCERDLVRTTAQARGNARASVFKRLFRGLAERIQAGRIAVNLVHVRQHGLN